ncbi:signal peptidase II [Bosea sp. ANAM02]|uniref:signal peptidase II n=1 Tax=Bosea sp. ANAM02 TaxID=2020412 RepID=UPI001FCEE976|nr:signal peptidase II [Bosea sp. ANAM02]
MMTTTKRLGQVLFWATAAAALDQLTKWLILTKVMTPPRIIELTPFFNLRLGFNYGVSFGFGSDWLDAWPSGLAAFKLMVAVGLLVWAVRSHSRFERIGLALIAGGALGNAQDRWRQGAVTDFLDLHWGDWHWPTFNGADIAISSGVLLILMASLSLSASNRVRAKSSAEGHAK